jgi:hypothetical protein
MVPMSSLLTFFLLLQLGTQGAFAWTLSSSPTTTSTTRTTAPVRFSPIRSSTPSLLYSSPLNNNENQENNHPSSSSNSLSRREWFWGVTQAAAAAAAAVALPTSASATAVAVEPTKPPPLVTTASVCDPTVSIWTRGNRIIYLLGTAHISEGSAQLAGQLVKDVVPEGVFVELDIKRVGGLGPGGPKPGASSVSDKMNLDTSSTTALSSSIGSMVGSDGDGSDASVPRSILVIPTITPAAASSAALSGSSASGASAPASVPAVRSEPKGLAAKALNFGAQGVGNAIKGMYKNLDSQGFKPGEEFVLAVQEGQKIGAAIILGDQDVELTLRRLVQALAETDINKLMDPNSDVNRSMQELLPTSPGGGPSPSAVSTSGSDSTVSKEEFSSFIETMKTRDNVRQIMGQLKEVAPQLVDVMLTERDTYMAAGLNTLNQFHSIVAVMGIAHVDGVERNLKNEGWQQVTPRCPKQ